MELAFCIAFKIFLDGRETKTFIILGPLQDFILENALKTDQGGWEYDLTFFLMISLGFLVKLPALLITQSTVAQEMVREAHGGVSLVFHLWKAVVLDEHIGCRWFSLSLFFKFENRWHSATYTVAIPRLYVFMLKLTKKTDTNSLGLVFPWPQESFIELYPVQHMCVMEASTIHYELEEFNVVLRAVN